MTTEIPVSGGVVALVDDEDAHLFAGDRWHKVNKTYTFYAARGVDAQMMHRILLQPPDGMQVDHIDGNGLNNQRSNLRLCTNAENARNQRKRPGTSSPYKGVKSRRNRWHASIEQNGVGLHLGIFDDPERAARQYDRAARVLFGRFAKTNAALGLLPPERLST